MKTQLQILPLIAILALFLIGPILIIFVVSFWDYTEFSLVPDFVLTNYVELFESSVTYSIYLNTLKFAALSWILTLVIGFGVVSNGFAVVLDQTNLNEPFWHVCQCDTHSSGKQIWINFEASYRVSHLKT